jgi:hypothetical protein
MDRREPSRIVAAAPVAGESDRLPPFARITNSHTARRLATPRIVGATSAAILALILVWIVGTKTVPALVAWLNDRPLHNRPFREIELDPAPPPWILMGRAGLLAQVRERAGLADDIPVLAEDLAQLRKAFARESPWVKRVLRIERLYPNRLIVRLEYRKPVAFVRLRDETRLYLDHDGVVLPAGEIDPDATGLLIGLRLKDLIVSGARSGQTASVSETDNGPPLKDPIPAACAFATFLLSKTAGTTADEIPFRVEKVHVIPKAISLEVRPAAMILWAPTAPKDLEGGPSDEQKWAWLRDWAHSHQLEDVSKDEYLDFTRTGIVLRYR